MIRLPKRGPMVGTLHVAEFEHQFMKCRKRASRHALHTYGVELGTCPLSMISRVECFLEIHISEKKPLVEQRIAPSYFCLLFFPEQVFLYMQYKIYNIGTRRSNFT